MWKIKEIGKRRKIVRDRSSSSDRRSQTWCVRSSRARTGRRLKKYRKSKRILAAVLFLSELYLKTHWKDI